MENNLFSTNAILNTLTEVDAAAAATANNVANAFSTASASAQLSFLIFKDTVIASFLELDAAILNTQAVGDVAYVTLFNNAQVYADTFKSAFLVGATEIDAAILNTQIMGNTAYGTLFGNAQINADAFKNTFLTGAAEIDAAIQNTQTQGDLAFLSLFGNAFVYYTTFKDGLFIGLNEASAKCSEFAGEMENSFCIAFENSKTGVLESIETLKNEASVKLGEMQTSAEYTALGIKEKFKEEFSAIEDEFAQMVESLKIGFADSISIVNQGVKDWGDQTKRTNDDSKSSFESVCDAIGFLSDGLSIATSAMDLHNKGTKVAKSLHVSFIAVMNSGIAANTAHAGSTALVTAGETTAGAASYGAAAGFLAAGAGVLMMGVGILMTVSAIILLLTAIGAVVAGISLGMISGMISSFKNEKAQGYATGGFPSTGQMFIAREAGPELVGTIGSRSAVVNNEQIVESVSRGVYDAVRAALGGGTAHGGTTEVKLYLDGKQITAAVEKVQRERGLSLSNRSLVMA